MNGFQELTMLGNAQNVDLSIGIKTKNEIPAGYCQCGCGKKTTIARYSNKKLGHVKGKPNKFVCGHYIRSHSPRINNGRALLYMPENSRANNKGYVFRYLLVAEKALGKPILKKHPVHHIDSNKINDNPNNLVICESHAYHTLLHKRTAAYRECGNPNFRKCWICKQYDSKKNLYISKDKKHIYHRSCKSYMIKKFSPRWYVVEFDRNWVRCQHCGKEFFLNTVIRKNKCPNCKLSNTGFIEQGRKYKNKKLKWQIPSAEARNGR